ncbi:MAG: hypothetical protein M1818_005708 [Claussenomyces sp. TS43310]|nr:MAG: hypothetical protein M1818_005708 [Claussenomyces sp. TS43310]
MALNRQMSITSQDTLYLGDRKPTHKFLKNIPPEDDPNDSDYQPSTAENSEDDSTRTSISTQSDMMVPPRSAKKRKHPKTFLPMDRSPGGQTCSQAPTQSMTLSENASNTALQSRRSTESLFPSPPSSPRQRAGLAEALDAWEPYMDEVNVTLTCTPPQSPEEMTESSHNNSLFNERSTFSPRRSTATSATFDLPHRSNTAGLSQPTAPVARMYSTQSPRELSVTQQPDKLQKRKRTSTKLRPKKAIKGDTGTKRRAIPITRNGTKATINPIQEGNNGSIDARALTDRHNGKTRAPNNSSPGVAMQNKPRVLPGILSESPPNPLPVRSPVMTSSSSFWYKIPTMRNSSETGRSSVAPNLDSDRKNRFDCAVCGETSPNFRSKLKHNQQHSSSTCQGCRKTFESKQLLASHSCQLLVADMPTQGSCPENSKNLTARQGNNQSSAPMGGIRPEDGPGFTESAMSDQSDDPMGIYNVSPRTSATDSMRGRSELSATATPTGEDMLNPQPSIEDAEEVMMSVTCGADDRDMSNPILGELTEPFVNNPSVTLEPENERSPFLIPKLPLTAASWRLGSCESATVEPDPVQQKRPSGALQCRERSQTLDHQSFSRIARPRPQSSKIIEARHESPPRTPSTTFADTSSLLSPHSPALYKHWQKELQRLMSSKDSLTAHLDRQNALLSILRPRVMKIKENVLEFDDMCQAPDWQHSASAVALSTANQNIKREVLSSLKLQVRELQLDVTAREREMSQVESERSLLVRRMRDQVQELHQAESNVTAILGSDPGHSEC